MSLDIILIVLFVFMMIYGYIKGCIGIVSKLVSVILAFVLAYLLAGSIGSYIANTSWGENISNSIKNSVITELDNSEQSTIISMVQQKLNVGSENGVLTAIVDYVFTGIGFVIVFIASRLVLWIAQKILENIFELPILKTFNKLGGIIAAAILFVIEVSIILAVIKSISSMAFMNSAVNMIQSSIITKALYDHNIFTNLILSKII